MSKPLHPVALFRLMVLGPLASRGELKRGEVSTIIRELASKTYDIPDSKRAYLSTETIKRWYHDWKRGSIDALQPKERLDKGTTQLLPRVQERLLQLKQDNPSRSINLMITMMESSGFISKGSVARASVHRFLKQLKLSKRILPSVNTIEHRSFVAAHAGDIWQGDVLHGPSIQTKDGLRKTYLVSLMDDASRLLAHSAFCFSETALDIEGVLKQAVLKRGRPYKLLVDNGAAYKSGTLQAICARLEIRLIYCRPYSPEGKGKLERFHRTFREQFLNELNLDRVANIDELNARLWAWIETVYHTRPHAGLDKLDTKEHQTPIARWRQDLQNHVRPLTTAIAGRLDDIFCHYIVRTVRKDGTVSWEGRCFEVHHNLVGEKVTLVVDPHTQTILRIESAFGDNLGQANPIDRIQNTHRKRQRPHQEETHTTRPSESMVEIVHQDYNNRCALPIKEEEY
ncbi:MAG: DDE-type integrase/transposase/recombinase [bacterium]|nr:DDE-type integrase/transposase/recombinase [bacterium]